MRNWKEFKKAKQKDRETFNRNNGNYDPTLISMTQLIMDQAPDPEAVNVTCRMFYGLCKGGSEAHEKMGEIITAHSTDQDKITVEIEKYLETL